MTKAKIQIGTGWFLKVGATFNNGYSGVSAKIINGAMSTQSGNFHTIDGETYALIPLGANDTFASCTVQVSAMKSTPQGPSVVFASSTNVKVTN